jgi:hypothetical protein
MFVLPVPGSVQDNKYVSPDAGQQQADFPMRPIENIDWTACAGFVGKIRRRGRAVVLDKTAGVIDDRNANSSNWGPC